MNSLVDIQFVVFRIRIPRIAENVVGHANTASRPFCYTQLPNVKIPYSLRTVLQIIEYNGIRWNSSN